MTTGYVTFEGRVVPMIWGRATYIVLPLPDDVVQALGGAKRVEGEINEHPVNLAPSRAPVIEGTFLWAGQSLLDRIGLVAGDPVEVRLRPAAENVVDLPADVESALHNAGLTDRWQALTPGKRRGLLYPVDSARSAATRASRITRLLDGLA